ncbi:MAG TPA: hypothetical protein VFI14_09560 [Chryseosolibacter sp.]|nr:hypothetical protein [Chryseosolibacter sp.]
MQHGINYDYNNDYYDYSAFNPADRKNAGTCKRADHIIFSGRH